MPSGGYRAYTSAGQWLPFAARVRVRHGFGRTAAAAKHIEASQQVEPTSARAPWCGGVAWKAIRGHKLYRPVLSNNEYKQSIKHVVEYRSAVAHICVKAGSQSKLHSISLLHEAPPGIPSCVNNRLSYDICEMHSLWPWTAACMALYLAAGAAKVSYSLASPYSTACQVMQRHTDDHHVPGSAYRDSAESQSGMPGSTATLSPTFSPSTPSPTSTTCL